MLSIKNPCTDSDRNPAPSVYRFRQNYAASNAKELKITVPAGTIELQWMPKNCDDSYQIDGCHCHGSFSAVYEAIYFDCKPVPNEEIVIILDPCSTGQLAFRSLVEITPKVEFVG